VFWVSFTAIGIVDIVMLPPGETFDRFFLRGHCSGQFEEETRPNSRSESRKGTLLHLDNARFHLGDHEMQANSLTQLSHPAHSQDLAPANFLLWGYLKNYAGREFIRSSRGAARTGDGHFNVNPDIDLQSSI
jgi:hypothetical protein